MSDPTPLTEKQQHILDFIRTHIEGQGYPPTIRDICKQFAIKSPNGVMCHLRALAKKGRINRNEKLSRGITIEGVMPGSSRGGRAVGGSFGFPLLGVVAAGKAIETMQQDERLELNELFPTENVFALKVRGTSMIESQIADGDYVVIRKQESADNGEKVVAMIDKAMTLKKYYRRKDYIELVPANGSMTPIKVDPEKQEIQILGVLVGVIRRC